MFTLSPSVVIPPPLSSTELPKNSNEVTNRAEEYE
jgi:hypothetical protein